MLEDLKAFLLKIVKNYADELKWGDELNGLTIMNTRVDQMMEDTMYDIIQNQEKLGKLQNKEYVRSLEYNNKKTEFARNIKQALTHKTSIKENTLEALMIEKISGQDQRIEGLKKIVQ